MDKDVIAYMWVLGLAASLIITVIGILRWLADKDNRKHKLNIICGCAFVIFLLLLLSANWGALSGKLNNWVGNSAADTNTLIGTSKGAINVLLMLFIVAFAILFGLIAILFVIYGLWAIIHTVLSLNKGISKEDLKNNLQEKAEKFTIMLSTPAFIVIITSGILAIFGLLPIILGNSSQDLIHSWMNGVEKIGKHFNKNEDAEFLQSMSLYLLFYISVLGIGFAVANILFVIIKEFFERKERDSFFSKYSNSIGLLAVGISVLYMISSGKLDLNSNSESSEGHLLLNFAKSFGIVIVIIAMGVLTLEVVRLLMDKNEKLLQKEARYLFALLVGQCGVIIVKIFSLIFNAFSSALSGSDLQSGSAEERMGSIQERIYGEIEKDVNEEIDDSDRMDCTKILYRVFERKVTRK